MKQVLAVGLALSPALSSKVPSSLLDEGEGECFSHSCGKGYIPKFDHDTRRGNSDVQCCQPTCESYTCSGNFVANEAYKGNIGRTNEQCCDQTCSAVKCPEGKKVPADLKKSPGKTEKECCKDTCNDFSCKPFTVPIGANQHEVYPDGEAQSFCCEPTCQAYTCDVAKNLTLDPAKATLTKVSDETCCTPTCGSVTCPAGFKIHPSKVNMDAKKTVAAVGNTDEVCCQRTCEVFQCSSGWAKNSAAAKNIGVDDPTCCLPECSQYQPKCEGDYAPNPDANKTVGQTADVCCKKTCSLYACSDGSINIPDAKSVVASTNGECCEDARCPTFRKKTEVKDGCNHSGKDECENNYMKSKNTATNKTDSLACKWADFGFCQVNALEPANCAE